MWCGVLAVLMMRIIIVGGARRGGGGGEEEERGEEEIYYDEVYVYSFRFLCSKRKEKNYPKGKS